jgi:predicted MFS family arabinose efflux permease
VPLHGCLDGLPAGVSGVDSCGRGEADLAAANALNETVENLALPIGPAVGGVLLAVASPQVAIGFNWVTFLASAVLVGLLRHRTPAAVEEHSLH